MSESPTQLRPRWVRLALGRISTRRVALSQCTALLANLIMLLACIALPLSGSETLFGMIGLGVVLAGMVVDLILILWVWLAVRWVDRHGQWA
jgi:hypothetical protein